jgi:hypothetical protein
MPKFGTKKYCQRKQSRYKSPQGISDWIKQGRMTWNFSVPSEWQKHFAIFTWTFIKRNWALYINPLL